MDFRIALLETSSVLNLYLAKDEIWLDPPYQRAADIWGLEKRQLLIDSLLNGFDIPKFYLHDFYPGETIAGVDYKMAIIDGKQRLTSIWSFIDGDFPLSNEIELLNSPDVNVQGMTYAELAREYPRLKAEFDSRRLSVITIQAADTELIEEMFSRLNEAVPLSAAEKRNALRGPLPPLIRDLATEDFFARNLPFGNSRYRHFDLACKMLYLTHTGAITDLKKAYLDGFVIDFREKQRAAEAKACFDRSRQILDLMSSVFIQADPLLRQIGMVTLYYVLMSDYEPHFRSGDLSRQDFERLNVARAENRAKAEKGVAEADYGLLEFDRLAQSPNDAVSLKFRYDVLREFLGLVAS